MVGESADQGGVFAGGGWTKNGLGKLAVALVAASRELAVKAAAAGLRVGRRGHALCIAGIQ